MAAALLRSASGTPSCSGRNAACNSYNGLCRPCRLPALAQSAMRRSTATVFALYNFAEAAETRERGLRRNRSVLKKEARTVLELVRGLTAMSAKQLAAVAHLLPPGTVEAVEIAARLPRSNQGRKRQEALVAKMLRGQVTELQMGKLEEAVAFAADNSGVYDDGDVSGRVAAWREGLLEGDQAVVAEVYGYPASWGPDHQQLRALVRQCQQALEEERSKETAVQQTSPSPSSRNSSSDDDEDAGEAEEDLAALLAAAGGGRRRRTASSEPRRSRALLRSLNRLLRPLAVRVVQEEKQQEEEVSESE